MYFSLDLDILVLFSLHLFDVLSLCVIFSTKYQRGQNLTYCLQKEGILGPLISTFILVIYVKKFCSLKKKVMILDVRERCWRVEVGLQEKKIFLHDKRDGFCHKIISTVEDGRSQILYCLWKLPDDCPCQLSWHSISANRTLQLSCICNKSGLSITKSPWCYHAILGELTRYF